MYSFDRRRVIIIIVVVVVVIIIIIISVMSVIHGNEQAAFRCGKLTIQFAPLLNALTRRRGARCKL